MDVTRGAFYTHSKQQQQQQMDLRSHSSATTCTSRYCSRFLFVLYPPAGPYFCRIQFHSYLEYSTCTEYLPTYLIPMEEGVHWNTFDNRSGLTYNSDSAGTRILYRTKYIPWYPSSFILMSSDQFSQSRLHGDSFDELGVPTD